MNEERWCGNCRYNKRDWTNRENLDFYCSNEDSDAYGCNTLYEDGCDEWEEMEEDEKGSGTE